MTSSTNPIERLDETGRPHYELKQSLVLYLDYAPGPKRARRLYDLYMATFSKHVAIYAPTGGAVPARWDTAARFDLESRRLPALRSTNEWGFAFSDGQRNEQHLFMFHGYKPVTESGKASFFRFTWPWDYPSETIGSFARQVADTVPFLSGTAGYIITTRPFHEIGFNAMFAFCQRYWGIEAWSLDRTVDHVLTGYKVVSWLTLIGERLLAASTARADLVSIRDLGTPVTHGTIYQSRPRPDLIDRHQNATFVNEKRVALALQPLQITEHAPFGGPKWTEDRTMEWLRRFS